MSLRDLGLEANRRRKHRLITPTVPLFTFRRYNPAVLLNSWKEIATYLKSGIRTAQRWHRDLHMPVLRVRKGKRGPVMAYSEALDAWIKLRSLTTEPDHYRPAAQKAQAPRAGASPRAGVHHGLDFLRMQIAACRLFVELAQADTRSNVAARRRHSARRTYDTIQLFVSNAVILTKSDLNQIELELRELRSELQKLGETF